MRCLARVQARRCQRRALPGKFCCYWHALFEVAARSIYEDLTRGLVPASPHHVWNETDEEWWDAYQAANPTRDDNPWEESTDEPQVHEPDRQIPTTGAA